MLSGTYQIPKVLEESLCRNTKDYRFTEIGIYQIHSNVLMADIEFEESQIIPEELDDTIFINNEKTKPDFNEKIEMQNYLSTLYVGRAPLEYYDDGLYTKMGRQFYLICKDGIPLDKYRYFGTKGAIHGTNRGANENVQLPEGGET